MTETLTIDVKTGGNPLDRSKHARSTPHFGQILLGFLVSSRTAVRFL